LAAARRHEWTVADSMVAIPRECRVELSADVEALDHEVVPELRRHVGEWNPTAVRPPRRSILLARVDPQPAAFDEQHSHPLERDRGPRRLGDPREDLAQIDRLAERSSDRREGRERARSDRQMWGISHGAESRPGPGRRRA
jgi:hypothetical protein